MLEYLIAITQSYLFWGVTGFIICYPLALYNLTKNGLSFPKSVFTVTLGIYGGLLGGRVLYVLLFLPGIIKLNPIGAISFWQRTGTWLGAPMGAFILLFITLKLLKKPFWSTIGSIAPAMALAHGISRIGCIMAGCCYGAKTDVWWAVYSQQARHTVHPTPAYSLAGELISFVILQTLWRKKQARRYLFPLYVMFLSTHRFISEFFRGCDSGISLIPGLRIFQVVCIVLFLLSVIALLILRNKHKVATIISITIISFSILAVYFPPEIMNKETNISKTTKEILVISRSFFSKKIDAFKKAKKGHSVIVKLYEDAPSHEEIKDYIDSFYTDRKYKNATILIVGDALPFEENYKPEPWSIPACPVKSINTYSEAVYASDTIYGDIDKDAIPDIPVGRIPVRSLIDLESYITKIKSYSTVQKTPDWNKVVYWIGADGYSKSIHTIAEKIVPFLPGPYTYKPINNPSNPMIEPELFLKEMGVPHFLSLIVSHGSAESVVLNKIGDKQVFFSSTDVKAIQSSAPSGMLILIGCGSGAFNRSGHRFSLSERFLNHDTGPITVAASSGPTNPVTNYLMVKALIHSLTLSDSSDYGELMMHIYRYFSIIKSKSLYQLSNEDPEIKNIMNSIPFAEKNYFTIQGLVANEMLQYSILGDPTCHY